MAADRKIRFAVGVPEGPCSAVWSMWCTGNELYLAIRDLLPDVKFSFHSSGHWREAYAEVYQRRDQHWPSTVDRAFDKWERPAEMLPGLTLAYLVLIPASELRIPPRPPQGQPKVYWHPAPRPGWASLFGLIIEGDGVAKGPEPMNENLGTVVESCHLGNGETAHLFVHDALMPDHWLNSISDLRANADGFLTTQKGGDDPILRASVGSVFADGTHFSVEFAPGRDRPAFEHGLHAPPDQR